MAKGIIGRKIGMTQIFDENGLIVPVTIVEALPNVVLQKKSVETDGYVAVQLGLEDKKEKHSTKAEIGHAKKANSAPKRFVKEIRDEEFTNSLEVGTEVTVNIFEEGQFVDVQGTSKGKGFAGSIKRHNQSRGPMAHGSRYHRGPGSMGPIKGNMKGKNLPGHMGSETVTVQNLKVVKVDAERNILLIKGNIPGSKQSQVVVKAAVKKQ